MWTPGPPTCGQKGSQKSLRRVQAASQMRPTLHVRSFKSGLKPRDLQVLCGGKGFSALGGFKVAQNDGTYTGSCGFLAQHPVNWDGFKLCTLQSGDKTPSTPPWRGSLSTATKHRQYQCFQLLQFARVASNHAMDRVFCGCSAKNLITADGFSSVKASKMVESTWCFEKCLGFSTWCFALSLIL